MRNRIYSQFNGLAVRLFAIIAIILFIASCTDSVLNPEQVVPTTGLVYRGNNMYKDDVAAIDSASGNPVRIVFARLGGESGGNGTYESPFAAMQPALDAAAAGDIVMVFRGTDPGLGSFSIPDGVRLFSDHPFQQIPTRNLGYVYMPLTGTEPHCKVNGVATMGNDTEISGFQFDNHLGNGIYAEGVSNVKVGDCLFVGTHRQGVFFKNVSGTIEIHDNQVFGTVDSTSPGIFIENSRVTMNAWVYRNSVRDPSGDGIKILTTGTGITVATIDSNTVFNSVGSGIKFFSYDNANTTAVISNNVVTRNRLEESQDGAIRFGTFDDITGKVTVINNRVENVSSNGIFIGSEHRARTEVNILNNNVFSCVGNGIFVGAQHTSFQKALISNNVVQRVEINPETEGFPTGHGIFTGSLYTGSEDVTVTFNRCYENDKNGIFCATFNGGKLDALLSDNLISNNGANGIELNSGLNVPPPGPDQVAPPLPDPGVNRGKFRVYNNVVAGNRGEGEIGQEGGGITGLVFNGADFEAVFQNNHLNDNGGGNGAYAALGVLVFDNSTANIAARYNTFHLNPASPAVNFRTFGAIPPAVPVPGVFPTLCLELRGNVSDTGYLLTKDQDTEFTAIVAENQGPVLIPFQLNNDPNCTPPQ